LTLFAQHLLGDKPLPVRRAAWYTKALPTFADTRAFVRKPLWPTTFLCMSAAKPDMVEIPRALCERLTDTLAQGA